MAAAERPWEQETEERALFIETCEDCGKTYYSVDAYSGHFAICEATDE